MVALKYKFMRPYKGRERIKRGKLKNFYDLPFCVQENFKKISRMVKESDNTIQEVFVYGSYFWGNWDSQSDYDVRINQNFNGSWKDLKDTLMDEYGLSVDLMPHKNPRIEMNLVVIPD